MSRLTVGFSREDENAEEWNPLKTPLSPHSEADSVPNHRLSSAGVEPKIRAREQNGDESVLRVGQAH
jgi:hypothetical protein